MKSVLFNSNQHLRDANPEYSYCLCCGKPWNLVKSKIVQTSGNGGSFATCDECWHTSSLDELKQYHAELYIKQKESILGMNTKMEHSLEHVLFCVEKEFFKL
ncbi:hypothetical protein FY557_17550 [Chryseobacterium sp. SN22]|uniref:hypothetical protein n=1 Tax=Chryseobacterium sp. SN22 TaxID=2606431 RepID=UPI0011ED283B|nr:hypothetical protein [Chryseobacterium sp. SN22]KAA0126455.1 hypothetical protein FY557_17550 [Chryseobacterium sp. SN22]